MVLSVTGCCPYVLERKRAAAIPRSASPSGQLKSHAPDGDLKSLQVLD